MQNTVLHNHMMPAKPDYSSVLDIFLDIVIFSILIMMCASVYVDY